MPRKKGTKRTKILNLNKFLSHEPPVKVYQPPVKVPQPPVKVYQPPVKVPQPPVKVYQPPVKVPQPSNKYSLTEVERIHANKLNRELVNFALRSLSSGLIGFTPNVPPLKIDTVTIPGISSNIKLLDDTDNKDEVLRAHIAHTQYICTQRHIYAPDITPIRQILQVVGDIEFRRVFYFIAIAFTSKLADILPTIRYGDTFAATRRQAIDSIWHLRHLGNKHLTILTRYYWHYYYIRDRYNYLKTHPSHYFPHHDEYEKPFMYDTFPKIMRKLLVNEIKQRVINSKCYPRSFREFYRRFYTSLNNNVLPKDALELSITKCMSFRKFDKVIVMYEPKCQYYHFFFKALANSNLYTNNRDWNGKDPISIIYENLYPDDNSDIVTLTKKTMVWYRVFLTRIFSNYIDDYNVLQKVVLRFH